MASVDESKQSQGGDTAFVACDCTAAATTTVVTASASLTTTDATTTAQDGCFVGSPQRVEDWPMITMYDKDFREELQSMHQSITELKLWEQMKLDPGHGGYAFSNADYIDKIVTHPLNEACGHSGYTQAYCMRMMQQIARLGWTAFADKHKESTAKLNPMRDACGDGVQ